MSHIPSVDGGGGLREGAAPHGAAKHASRYAEAEQAGRKWAGNNYVIAAGAVTIGTAAGQGAYVGMVSAQRAGLTGHELIAPTAGRGALGALKGAGIALVGLAVIGYGVHKLT